MAIIIGTPPGSGGTTPQVCEMPFFATSSSAVINSGDLLLTFPAPLSFEMDAIEMYLNTPQTSGAVIEFDLRINGVSAFSTLVTIDNGENSSNDAATPPVINNGTINKGDIITVYCTDAGDGTARQLFVNASGIRI